MACSVKIELLARISDRHRGRQPRITGTKSAPPMSGSPHHTEAQSPEPSWEVANCWRLRSRTIPLPRRPLLMGIVNVTPDSFSDGGRFLDHERAVEHGVRLVHEGAAMLDIGGESTRPYAQPVSVDEELRRVLPVIRVLARRVSVPISVDTSKAQVAEAALDAGAEVINDVTGLEGDPHMLPLAVRAGAGLCVMHMQGRPDTMQDNPTYADVVENVLTYLRQRRDALVEAGVDAGRICLDVGLGFGKNYEHNLELLRNISRFHQLGCPLLVGHSRKGFLGKMLGDLNRSRDDINLGVALAMARQHAQILRVHDVRKVHDALLGFELAGGLTGCGQGFCTAREAIPLDAKSVRKPCRDRHDQRSER